MFQRCADWTNKGEYHFSRQRARYTGGKVGGDEAGGGGGGAIIMQSH